MQTEYKTSTFQEQDLRCDKCGWTGKGADAVLIDFYGVVKDKEIHCPACDEKLGILKRDDDSPGESASDLSFQFG
jgi:hypothetical protein